MHVVIFFLCVINLSTLRNPLGAVFAMFFDLLSLTTNYCLTAIFIHFMTCGRYMLVLTPILYNIPKGNLGICSSKNKIMRRLS